MSIVSMFFLCQLCHAASRKTHKSHRRFRWWDLFFYLPYPKPPVLPDVRNRAINGSADLALRRKNYEQDEKTSAFAPVQACGYGSTGADPAEVPLYISFLSHYSSKAPGNLFQGFRGPCCCHDHLRRGWICTSGIATLS